MRILAVFAHPDDEAFGPAGTLSRYSMSGHRVHLLTMTHGEAGTLGPARHLTALELGALRSRELRCSAEALKLSGLDIFDLADGKLAEVPQQEGVQIVGGVIDTFLPDALISFHSAGISGHSDHQAVARWCLQAVQERKNALRLFAFGISPDQARRVRHRKLDPIPEEEITHVINVSSYLQYKFEAIRCHQSQRESWERMNQVEGGVEAFLQNEHFAQIWPAPRMPCRRDCLED